MRTRVLSLCIALLLPLAGACRKPAPPSDTGAAGDSVAAAEPAAAHDSSHAGAAGQPQALRPIMQQLAAELAGLTHGLWLDDYQVMAGHAERIAGHTEIAPDEVRRIETTLGAEAPAFTAADEAVHEAALRLDAAVKARDAAAVLARLGEVQRGCVACHAQFRERLRTDRL